MRLRNQQFPRRLRRVGHVDLETIDPAPQVSSPCVERDARIGAPTHKPGVSVDAILGDVSADDHCAEKLPCDALVPVTYLDKVIERSLDGCRRIDRVQPAFASRPTPAQRGSS